MVHKKVYNNTVTYKKDGVIFMCLKPKFTYGEAFADFEEQEKRDTLGKGLFWLVKNDEEKFELFCVKMLCYRDGETLEKIETGECESEKLNHERAWSKLDKAVTQGKPYNFYPRGRVQIKKGKATVYLNPILNDGSIVDKICRSFGLTKENGIVDIRIKNDNSRHYQFLMEK